MGDIAAIVLVVVGWILINRVVLPKLGVPT